jgi:hypothetical protein
MSQNEPHRLSYDRIDEVEDPHLVQLDERFGGLEAIHYGAILGEAERGGRAAEPKPEDAEPPFDLEVPKPRAVDVRKFYKLVNQPVPPEIEAALGPNIPVLLYHGLTPFHRPGRQPLPVWGMGYEAELVGTDASTVSWQPDNRFVKLAGGKLEAAVGLSAAGAMETPPATLKFLKAVPGVTLQGAKLHATSDVQFSLAVQFDLMVLEVQAGAVGAGGVRWNLYQNRERLDRFQPLLHTLLVPKGTKSLKVKVQTWVRSRARWLGLIKARQWSPKPVQFEVSLEGLEG